LGIATLLIASVHCRHRVIIQEPPSCDGRILYKVPVLSTELTLLNEPQDALYAARYTLYPEMLHEELPVQGGLTECVDASVPVPLGASTVADGTGLLVKLSVALALPAT
jgi:hypothetical protein